MTARESNKRVKQMQKHVKEATKIGRTLLHGETYVHGRGLDILDDLIQKLGGVIDRISVSDGDYNR